MRKVILIVLAVVTGLGTMLMVNMLMTSEPPPPPPPTPVAKAPEAPKTFVLVAANDLPTGTLVRQEHLKWQEWGIEANNLPPTYVVQGRRSQAEFNGSVVRKSVKAGEPITEGSLVKPGEQGFLAAVIKPGKEAISLEIAGSCGVAGFIFPGDRVNMMVIHDMPKRGEDGIRNRVASEMVMRNMRVLAVDQSTNDLAGVPKLAKYITLEVTSEQAEVVSIMPRIGQICFSLNGVVSGENAILADAKPVSADFELDMGDISISALEPESLLSAEEYKNGGDANNPFSAFDAMLEDGNSSIAWDRDVSSVRHQLSEEVPRVRLIRGEETSEISFGN